MRTLITWTLTLAAFGGAVGAASGQSAPQKKATAPAPAPVDAAVVKAQQADPDEAAQKALKAQQELNDLLAEWEKQSKKLTSLSVGFRQVDNLGPAWGLVHYQGQALLQSPDLACLQTTKLEVDAAGKLVQPLKPEREPYDRIVCTGEEVLQYKWDTKTVYVYPLEKQARQKALQQGPLPFLFNMQAAEVKQRYRLVLMGQNQDEYLIEIKPREEIDMDSFTKAYLWLNKKSFLPNKLRLHPVGDKETQEFVFNTIKANQPIDPVYFEAKKFAGWKVVNNPNQAARKGQAPAPKASGTAGRAAPGQVAPGRGVAQPAMRPGANPR